MNKDRSSSADGFVLSGDGHHFEAGAHLGGVLSGAEERGPPGIGRVDVDTEVSGFEDRGSVLPDRSVFRVRGDRAEDVTVVVGWVGHHGVDPVADLAVEFVLDRSNGHRRRTTPWCG